jgi:hypothetical protein
MKKALLIVALSLLPALASAQDIQAWIDYPAEQATVSASALRFDGWAFSCYYGQQPRDVLVYLVDNGSFAPIPSRTYWRIARPDVQAAFAGGCSYLGPYLGFSTYLLGVDLAPGPHTFYLMFLDAYRVRYEKRVVVVQ